MSKATLATTAALIASRTLQPPPRFGRGRCRRPQGRDGYAPARGGAAREADHLAISDESSRERLTHRQFERPPPISRRWRIARPPSPNLDWTIVRAPVNGFVTNLTLDVGQFASVGTKCPNLNRIGCSPGRKVS
jgi:hypothetical protein